jgi:hypothetical protein
LRRVREGCVGLKRSLLLLVISTAFATSCRATDELSSPNAPPPTSAAVEARPDHSDFRLSSATLPQGASLSQGDSQRPSINRTAGEYQHGFWDRNNILLFSLVGASRALDYSSTLNMRRRGRDEGFLTNDIVDNHAAFAAIEVGGTAISIGASYLFHRYHHHRLERWTSVVHASLATTGAIRNYCLKTAHPSSTP